MAIDVVLGRVLSERRGKHGEAAQDTKENAGEVEKIHCCFDFGIMELENNYEKYWVREMGCDLYIYVIYKMLCRKNLCDEECMRLA